MASGGLFSCVLPGFRPVSFDAPRAQGTHKDFLPIGRENPKPITLATDVNDVYVAKAVLSTEAKGEKNSSTFMVLASPCRPASEGVDFLCP